MEKENKNDFSDGIDEVSENEKISDGRIDAPTIDSLIYDDDDLSAPPTYETKESFEDFLADYKSAISNALSLSKAKREEDDGSDTLLSAQESMDIPSFDAHASEELTVADAYRQTEEQTSADYSYEPVQISMDLGDEQTVYEPSDDEEPTERAYDPEKPRFIDSVFEFVELFTMTLAAVFILTTFFFKHSIVDGGSMENTLHHEEHLIISDFLYTPKRGDVVVFQDYSTGYKNALVKRVIAIEGDTVKVDANGNVTVNGEELFEEYVYVDGAFPSGYIGRECVVPKGEVFVLGDHRNASSDSVSFADPTISVDSILGKVLLRIYPFDVFGPVD